MSALPLDALRQVVACLAQERSRSTILPLPDRLVHPASFVQLAKTLVSSDIQLNILPKTRSMSRRFSFKRRPDDRPSAADLDIEQEKQAAMGRPSARQISTSGNRESTRLSSGFSQMLKRQFSEGTSGDRSSISGHARDQSVYQRGRRPHILVLGAPGVIGSATVASLSEKLGYRAKIKIVVPRTDDDYATALSLLPGVSIVKASIYNTDEIEQSTSGVDLCLVIPSGVAHPEGTARELIEASIRGGVKMIVCVSSSEADKDSVIGSQYSLIEKYVKKAPKFTIVRLPLFIDSCLFGLSSVVDRGVLYGPCKPDAVYPHIAVEDVGLAIACILSAPDKHVAKCYTLMSRPFTYKDIARKLTAISGRPTAYVQASYEKTRRDLIEAGFLDWQVQGILEVLRDCEEKSAKDWQATGDYEKITGREPKTLRAVVKSSLVADPTLSAPKGHNRQGALFYEGRGFVGSVLEFVQYQLLALYAMIVLFIFRMSRPKMNSSEEIKEKR